MAQLIYLTLGIQVASAQSNLKLFMNEYHGITTKDEIFGAKKNGLKLKCIHCMDLLHRYTHTQYPQVIRIENQIKCENPREIIGWTDRIIILNS